VSKRTLPPIAASGALYVLALATGVLLSKPLALVLFILATVLLLLVVAGYERVQRHLPDLGRLPLVVDHGLHTRSSGAHGQSSVVEQARVELLRLAQTVRTELATCRARLDLANTKRDGWWPERSLPAEHYGEWSKSVTTADETVTNRALEAFYVWADHINGQMAERAANEMRSVGTVDPLGDTLTLSDEDVAELGRGMALRDNADVHIRAVIRRMSKDS
jgi:hypothetical protein